MAIAQLPGETIRDVTEVEIQAINIFAKNPNFLDISPGLLDPDDVGINVQVKILNDSDGSLNQEFTAENIILTTGQLASLHAIISTQIVPAINTAIESELGVVFV